MKPNYPDFAAEAKQLANQKKETIQTRPLVLSDNAMFRRVMSDEHICKAMVERILGFKVDAIVYHNTEQGINPVIGARGVRFDAYLKDESKVYNIEMQTYMEPKLGKRFRYYQSLMDADLLEEGQDYDALPESFIIFICTYDPCDLSLPRYDIERVCVQGDASFDCASHWIVLNASADTHDASESLSNLLQYIGKGKVAQGDTLIETIDNAVETANADRLWVRDVFCGLTEEDEIRIRLRRAYTEGMEKGEAAGEARGKAAGFTEGEAHYGKLVGALLADNRTQDLEAATKDPDKLAQLYKEYAL